MCAEDGISVMENDDYWDELANAPPITAAEICTLSKKAAEASGQEGFALGTVTAYFHNYWAKHPPTREGMTQYSKE